MTSPSPPSLAGPSDPPPSSIEVHNSSASIPPSISVDGHPIGRTMRVSQLDSSDLDDALVGMLGTRVADSLDNFGVSPTPPLHILARYQREIQISELTRPAHFFVCYSPRSSCTSNRSCTCSSTSSSTASACGTASQHPALNFKT